jgi:glycosyltransferase involved in cell wall biosynthesis
MLHEPPSLEILLATYNGLRFVEEQLESILSQTRRDWFLLMRDDGSSDATREHLEAFREQHHDRVHLLKDADRNLGPARNFSRLLEGSSAPHVMLCDQDDVWLPDKLERTLFAMLEAERRLGRGTPILVHTDLRPVNDRLEPIADSFWAYQHLDPARAATFRLNLVQNAVTGCTMMVNRALLEIALPIPDGAIMHDWWLTLVASAFGMVVQVPHPTVLYRQHGSNSVGAKRWGLAHILAQSKNPATDRSIERKLDQARVFLERYRERLSDARRLEVETFARLRECGPLERRALIVRHGFWFHGLARNLGWLVRI